MEYSYLCWLVVSIYPHDSWENAGDVKHRAIVTHAFGPMVPTVPCPLASTEEKKNY